MDFQCVCGKVLSMDVQPGAVVQCPACGRMIEVPGAAPAYATDGAPGYGPTGAREGNRLATLALVFGLLAILLGPLTGIPAVILGILALGKIKRSQGRMGGTGLAIAGLATGAMFTVVLCISGLVALMLPALARARGAARQVTCASNLRQIGIAMTNYATQCNGLMPPGDLNTSHYLVPFLGTGKAFQCPSHEWLPQQNRWTCSSYAFNISLDQAENEQYSPFSTVRTATYYSSSPADTILAVEMWMRPRPDGTFPNELRLDDPDWSPIQAGVAPLSSYTAAKGATFDEKGYLIDPGPYRFLDCYKGTDVPVSRMYHNGKMNVLFVDGHVEPLDIRKLTARSPSKEPMWTHLLD